MLKEYEIWIGNYNLGQGYDPTSEPTFLTKIIAPSFNIACVIYEHQSAIESLIERIERGDNYIEDIHFGQWYYNVKDNSNSWTGKYFETKEEALKTFKRW